MIPSEKVNISIVDIKLYIQESIESRVRFCVNNYGGSYAWVENGVYSVKKQGFTRGVHKNPEAILSILTQLVKRYQNFEYKGYIYTYSGGWNRFKGQTDL
jgi:hypothetical protein